MKNLSFILLLIFVVAVTSVARADEKSPCDKNPSPIVEKCFKIRGRLSFFNGTPSFRIWVIGTHHRLHVTDWWSRNEEELPSNVRELLPPRDHIYETEIYGNYEVCPLDKERKGWALPICIKSASNLYAKHFEED